jgi:hypothetical protein
MQPSVCLCPLSPIIFSTTITTFPLVADLDHSLYFHATCQIRHPCIPFLFPGLLSHARNRHARTHTPCCLIQLSCYMLSFPPTFSHFASILAHSQSSPHLVFPFDPLFLGFIFAMQHIIPYSDTSVLSSTECLVRMINISQLFSHSIGFESYPYATRLFPHRCCARYHPFSLNSSSFPYPKSLSV